MKLRSLLFLWLTAVWIVGCTQVEEAPALTISLVADGRERTFAYNIPVTVGEFLRDTQVGIELGELDQVNPPPFTQLNDGMRITVVRVVETIRCEQGELPYQQRTVLNEGLQPGEERLGQAGQNGIEEVCYRVQLRDGQEREPVEINRTVITAPQDEVIYVGPTGEIEPVPIPGTLAYINNGNAWMMRGSSTTKRPLTGSSDLDKRVFSLSNDGRRLIFTRATFNGEGSFNHLWLMADVTQNQEPVSLVPGDVLWAEWIPNLDNTISYSTAQATQAAPGWLAFNDLWQMRIDPATGEALSVREIVRRSTGGLYGWWGTRFQWSNDGQQLAWVQADGLGLVDLETGELQSALLKYAVFRPPADWSWRATASWSADDNLILTTVHGPPVGRELPENSPAFNIAITDKAGAFSAEIVNGAGIWAAPRYSPLINNPDSEFPLAYIAYLRARDPVNSVNGEYDLVVADRDGSNARTVFPPSGQAGLRAQEFVWSPDGQQLAFIYLGNLWIVDVESQAAHQLTLDSGASNPVWSR